MNKSKKIWRAPKIIAMTQNVEGSGKFWTATCLAEGGHASKTNFITATTGYCVAKTVSGGGTIYVSVTSSGTPGGPS